MARQAGSTWGGLLIEDGGYARLSHVEILDADTALNAAPYSKYDVDHFVVELCTQMAQLYSGGTIGAGQVYGLSPVQATPLLQIVGASPQVSDVLIEQVRPPSGPPVVDLITVSGPGAAPLFNHVEVSGAGTAFVLEDSAHLTLAGASIHDNYLGISIGDTQGTVVSDSDFQRNAVPIGECVGGTVQASADYFDDARLRAHPRRRPASRPLTAAPATAGQFRVKG
jgi:hypothetical protein